MARYRDSLPQLGDAVFFSDGGLETTLVFHDARELPCFAAFPLLDSEEGRARLRRYFDDYLTIAREHAAGFVFDSVTWRANADWGERLGYSPAALADVNRRSIAFIEETLADGEGHAAPVVISGIVGPRGDGYDPKHFMTAAEAADYHRAQIEVFADTAADMISAATLNYADEAIGVVRAAREAGMPVAVSFTVETDGHLPTGESLKDAIEKVDAESEGGPAYYMINCAHPTHFDDALEPDSSWMLRVRGLRANASALSHAELDEATELDAGDPEALAQRYRALRDRFPQLTVLGGCCGTDERHMAAIGRACAARL
ncbi:MAG: homocysteine S-methyltransferase family protein [Deltaproteobacteria bacterium]|nr:homocysteine S-methyltransferase family protein [Deltaproteobacteria bacterium]MBW2420663.1 homocysteine S-methyltransferase family protein [Deltaproteobacteria bacterium]